MFNGIKVVHEGDKEFRLRLSWLGVVTRAWCTSNPLPPKPMRKRGGSRTSPNSANIWTFPPQVTWGSTYFAPPRSFAISISLPVELPAFTLSVGFSLLYVPSTGWVYVYLCWTNILNNTRNEQYFLPVLMINIWAS